VIALAPPLELSLGLRHDDTLCEPSRAAPGETVSFSLWAREGAVRAAALRCAPDGEEELHAMSVVERAAGHVRFQCRLAPRVARLRYRFRLEVGSGLLHLTMTGLHRIDPVDAFDFTWLGGAAPEWPLDAVLYQIFPDRFDDGDPASNVRDGEWSLRGTPTRARRFGELPLHWREAGNLDFYGGDLPGIERRLGYLASLGVTGLFLNPIWPALSNHRYDLVDHARVDPHLGGDAALASLSSALAARGMRLVLDVVLNHTGSGHPWFNRDGLTSAAGGAFRDRDAPERAYYRFRRWPDEYNAWLGFDSLPRLNLADDGLRGRLFRAPDSALRKFLRPPFSVDGYRFDVANMMGRDGAEQFHRELFAEIARSLRDENGDAWLLGEHFFDPDKLCKGDGLDGVMAYHAFTFPVRAWLTRRDRRGSQVDFDAADLVAHLRAAWARMGWPAARRSSLHVNTHDLPRLQTEGGDPRNLDVATGLQLALPGVPCLYYGDEIGLAGGADPDNRRCMEWDEARWDRPRLAETGRRVAARKSSLALRRGGFVDLGSRGDLLAFARVSGGETRLVVASRSDEKLTVSLPTGLLPGGRDQELELAPRSIVVT
jgi:alpha-glucosidase